MIYVESDLLVTTDTFVDACADLICAHFVFDIVYPKTLFPMLVFLQHTLMGIKDNQKLPVSVCTLLGSLSSHLVINVVVTIVPEGMSTLCTYLMLELMIIRTMQWLLTGSNYEL